ncbi:MAG: hypothetical protein J2P21_33445, partial [Chloracidobacterium sp.]|nr:hypothetical protein [Chloracidobacterium sp.]
MNPTLNTGLRRNGSAGGAAPETGETQNPFVAHYDGFDDDEKEKTEDQKPGRRRKLIGAAIFFMIIIIAGAGLWMISSGGAKTRINLPVREKIQKTDQAARGGDDATAQAIAEIRSATTAPSPALSATPDQGTVAAPGRMRPIIVPTTPVTVPIDGIRDTPATETATGLESGASRTLVGAAAKSGGNHERSIRCAPTPAALLARQPMAGDPVNARLIERDSPAVFKPAGPQAVGPPFGAMLPVRATGALYTLRPGLARFELTRDVGGQGWRLQKGTTIIGQQQGGEYDRAYISLMGFIDPESKRFVKMTGEILGADGAPGLKGKRRQIGSRWARILGRAVSTAVPLGQAALSRGNSTAVLLPGAVAPEL